MPQTGFNWTWGAQGGMLPTATAQDPNRMRRRPSFARGTLQTGLRRPPAWPGEDDEDELTDDELDLLERFDAEQGKRARAERDQARAGRAAPAPTPGPGQGPPGPNIPPQPGQGPPGPKTTWQPPEVPEGWEPVITVDRDPITGNDRQRTTWRLKPKPKVEVPKKDTVMADMYYEDGPTEDTYYEIKRNAAEEIISKKVVTRTSVVGDTTKKGPIVGPPGYEDIEGDDENQWEIWQDANGNEISRRMVPRESKEAIAAAKEAQVAAKTAGQRGFKPQSQKFEGGTWFWAVNDAGDTIKGTEQFIPDKEKKPQVWKPEGEIKTISVMPGGMRPDKTINNTGVVEEVKYQGERNAETSERREAVIGTPRPAIEAAYQGMREQAAWQLGDPIPEGAEGDVLRTRQMELTHEAREQATNKRLAAQAAYDKAQYMSQPRNWITFQGNQGKPPVVPANLARIIGQNAGDPLRPMPPPMPSAEQWAMLSPLDKEMFMGFLAWVGIDPAQWLMQLNQQWNAGAKAPSSVRWATPRQR